MRYSEQSRNLAASVVLEAAVSEAVALLRAPGQLRPVGTSRVSGNGWTLTSTSTSLLRYEWVKPDIATVRRTLLAAAETAELLIGRAS